MRIIIGNLCTFLISCSEMLCVASYRLELWGVLPFGMFSCTSSRCLSLCIDSIWIRFSFQLCHGVQSVIYGPQQVLIPLVVALPASLWWEHQSWLHLLSSFNANFTYIWYFPFPLLRDFISFLLLCSNLNLWILCSRHVPCTTFCLALLFSFTLCIWQPKRNEKALECLASHLLIRLVKTDWFSLFTLLTGLR